MVGDVWPRGKNMGTNMKKPTLRDAMIGTALIAIAVLPVRALAQVSADPVVVQEQDRGNEIVVTATRRESGILSVPLTVQAMNAEQLNNAGLRDLTALKFATPGYLPMTNAGFTQIFIRGIGNSLYIGADPSVATFMDDVPRIYGSMADNLVDVERIEVLKGAQGGLYGRNATGGVVNVITRDPVIGEFSGRLRTSYGEKNTFETSGYLNLPIGEKIAMTVSALRQSHAPYVRNVSTRNPYTAANFPNGSYIGSAQQTADFFNAGVSVPRLDDQDFWATRGKILILPSDNFKIVIAADYYRKHDNNGSANISTTPDFNAAALEQQFGYAGIVADLPSGFVTSPGKFEASIGSEALINVREYGVSGTLTWSLPDIDIMSISAIRHQSTDYKGGFGAQVYDFPVHVQFDRKFAYQEFRALSTFDGPWSVLGGMSYLHSQQDGETRGYFLSPQTLSSATNVHNDVVNWSFYAQLGYEFARDWELTLSGRYLYEKNKAEFSLPVNSASSNVQEAFIPSATLSYRLNGGNIYMRWARGFKTGGVNLVTAPSYFPRATDGSLFDPETVDTYEAGFKQALMGRRLQISGAVFYNDYRDIQADARALPAYTATIISAIINAKSARTWGVEGTVNWQALESLSLGVNIGYLNAKYKDFRLQDSQVLADFDLSGRQMPKAPELQLAVTANLDQPVSNKLNVTGNLLVSRTSSAIMQMSSAPGVLPDAVAPGFWLVNARIGLRTRDDRYSVALVADNVLNQEYFQYGLSNALGNMLGYGRPRIIRGEVSVHF